MPEAEAAYCVRGSGKSGRGGTGDGDGAAEGEGKLGEQMFWASIGGGDEAAEEGGEVEGWGGGEVD